jgi:hypothetical protein
MPLLIWLAVSPQPKTLLRLTVRSHRAHLSEAVQQPKEQRLRLIITAQAPEILRKSPRLHPIHQP